MTLTQERLKKILHYNPDTGVFTRLESGKVAGTQKRGGGRKYNEVCVDGCKYFNHILVFIYMTGSPPKHHGDHINGDSFDNRWCNLRDVTLSENNKNKCRDKRNVSGVTGVHWSKKEKSWKSQINVNGKRIHTGYFKDLAEAAMERWEAEIEHGFHPNHGRSA